MREQEIVKNKAVKEQHIFPALWKDQEHTILTGAGMNLDPPATTYLTKLKNTDAISELDERTVNEM